MGALSVIFRVILTKADYEIVVAVVAAAKREKRLAAIAFAVFVCRVLVLDELDFHGATVTLAKGDKSQQSEMRINKRNLCKVDQR